MSKVKQEHYVPQSYLRRFAHDGEQIHVFDKRELRAFTTNIKNVAAENGFYDIPEMEGREFPRQYVETNFLRGFEDEAVHAIDGLLRVIHSGVFRRLRGKRRSQLANWLVIQSLRSREYREEISEFIRSFDEMCFRAYLKETQPELAEVPFVLKLTPEAKRAHHVAALLDLDQIARLAWILMNHIWQVLRSDAPAPFWTSDNPVARHAHLGNAYRGRSGFRSRGIEFAYAVSPTTLLSLCDRGHFRTLAQLHGRMTAVPPESVTFYNSLQVIDSTRFVFSNAPDFSLAEDMCRENEELRNPNRCRFEVGRGSRSG